jgi:hypothetical protein
VDVLLAHVTVDHKVTAVLFPSATPVPSDATTHAPNQAIFSLSCRNAGNVSSPAKVAVWLGPLCQDASRHNVFGIRGTVESLRSNDWANTSRDYRLIETIRKSGTIDLLQRLAELNRSMARPAFADYRSGGDV